MTERDRAFCEYYLANGYNASKAYGATHPEVAASTCGNSGYRLLKRPEVKDYIRAREKEIFEANGINAEHICNELSTIAFDNIEENEKLTYQYKIKALELLGKQIDMFGDKVKLDGTQDIIVDIKGVE